MLIAGVDEAGRGPLAGPVVAAAVILDSTCPIDGLADSKKLSAKRREALAFEIKSHAVSWALGIADVAEIDHLNILWASMLAMKRAVECLSVSPDLVKVDGNRCPDIHFPSEAVVGGDASVLEISAASILAKVERDQLMLDLHQQYPEYGFDRHKGYPTRAHCDASRAGGVTPHHRVSFGPVARVLGSVRVARHVGFALAALRGDRDDVPWFRVVDGRGRVHTAEEEAGGTEQRDRLREEGVEVDAKGRVARFADLRHEFEEE